MGCSGKNSFKSQLYWKKKKNQQQLGDGHPAMKFVFTHKQWSWLDSPQPLFTYIHREERGYSKLVALTAIFLLLVCFPHCTQGAAVGEAWMQSVATQSMLGNTARAASFLFTCCSSEWNCNLRVRMEKKPSNKTYSDKIVELTKARKIRANTDNPALPVQLGEPHYLG